MNKQPKLGLQGPVIAWQDPWAGEASDEIMRTGTGSVYPSQDPTPTPSGFVQAMKDLGADFYVHHVLPNLAGQSEMIKDMVKHELDVCLGNEYGNINGPYVEGTNRYDIPHEQLLEAAQSGRLMGLLYDEPEHLQINAGQYRKDEFLPHWGRTDGLTLEKSNMRVVEGIAERVNQVQNALKQAGFDSGCAPLISEHVFPVMFHASARGGMTLCPKVMKESFQSLQLSTALGAAKQYNRDMWICADLWGPDVGEWFIRTSGFPGHSPEEYASALRMGYYTGPTHLFTENIDVLLRYDNRRFKKTDYGEVWDEFVHKFIPEHPITWNHRDADADIAFIHSDDSNYGQNERLYGNRELKGMEFSQSIFHVWHLLSQGTIPAHGSCMHISGFDFPRHRLKAEVLKEQFPLDKGREWGAERQEHPLFYPLNNVLVYDEYADLKDLSRSKLIMAAGSRISAQTLAAIRRRSEEGATIVIASWLVPKEWAYSGKLGMGMWCVTDNFLADEEVKNRISPFLRSPDCWTQRFGDDEVRMYKKDSAGFTLDFEIKKR